MSSQSLALSDEILMRVEKPARYIGNEINMVRKDPVGVSLRFAVCFPDVYEIGMSHLGIQILYHMFNGWEDVYCERVYAPWPDLHRIMKEQDIPLFTLETQFPVREMDFLGITLQYEMCYANVLQILDLSQIPLHSESRSWEHPIVIGGGPCAYNPEPLAEFFDLFYIGEGETRYRELFDLYQQCRREKRSRQEFLHAAAQLPGIYAPSMYEVAYHEDGTIASFHPRFEDIPATIHKEAVTDLTDTVYPTKPLVPFIKATQDRVVLEIMRGCIRGCRFCQAGMLYRPARERDVEKLKEWAYQMLKATGHEEITLSSLSSSDYSCLKELVEFLICEFKGQGVNISLPSLRIDAFSLNVMGQVQDVRKSSLTFAPEAGSQRLRDVINKGLTEEDILEGAGQAFAGGWQKVKLYFMLGLPTETEEDIREIPRLAERIACHYYEIPKERRNGKCQIAISASFFVPKPFTPFQWAPMARREEFRERARMVKEEMMAQKNRKSLKFNWHEEDVTILEGVFARGDRRVGRAIERAYELGCMFDSWTEYFDYEKWHQAFEDAGVSMDFYNHRQRELSEILPWDFIHCGVSKDFLKREWERAQNAIVTPNCRAACSGCGASECKGGVCLEHRGDAHSADEKDMRFADGKDMHSADGKDARPADEKDGHFEDGNDRGLWDSEGGSLT